MFNLQVGKVYDYWDDGKMSPSRHSDVVITEIIPFSEIDEGTKSDWEQESSSCYWLYAKETDYFAKGEFDSDDEDEKAVFVRTIDGGWFSLGFWAGRLTEKLTT